jgi:hypothetical protein
MKEIKQINKRMNKDGVIRYSSNVLVDGVPFEEADGDAQVNYLDGKTRAEQIDLAYKLANALDATYKDNNIPLVHNEGGYSNIRFEDKTDGLIRSTLSSMAYHLYEFNKDKL